MGAGDDDEAIGQVGAERVRAWSQAEATREIRKIARSVGLNLSYTMHARVRLQERGFLIGDLLYVLKNGHVLTPPRPSTRAGYNKYKMQCASPNSNDRSVGVVVIPDRVGCLLKIVTVMWIDATDTQAGSIVGE